MKRRVSNRILQLRLCGLGDWGRKPTLPFSPVIPAKAGIQRIPAKLATRNQVQIPTSGSLLPSWEKARMRVSPRASAALRAGRPRSHAAKPTPPHVSPVIPAKAGIQTLATKPAARNQARIPTSGSLLPSWEKARMRVSPRASAAPSESGFSGFRFAQIAPCAIT